MAIGDCRATGVSALKELGLQKRDFECPSRKSGRVASAMLPGRLTPFLSQVDGSMVVAFPMAEEVPQSGEKLVQRVLVQSPMPSMGHQGRTNLVLAQGLQSHPLADSESKVGWRAATGRSVVRGPLCVLTQFALVGESAKICQIFFGRQVERRDCLPSASQRRSFGLQQVRQRCVAPQA